MFTITKVPAATVEGNDTTSFIGVDIYNSDTGHTQNVPYPSGYTDDEELIKASALALLLGTVKAQQNITIADKRLMLLLEAELTNPILRDVRLQLNETTYYFNGYFLKESQRGWLQRRHDIHLSKALVTIERYYDRAKGLITVTVLLGKYIIVASTSRRVNNTNQTHRAVDDCLYELLIKGWVTPCTIKDYFESRGLPKPSVRRAKRDFLIIDGFTYDVAEIERAYYDWLDGLLPDSTVMMNEMVGNLKLLAEGIPTKKLRLDVCTQIYKMGAEVKIRMKNYPAVTLPDIVTIMDYAKALAWIARSQDIESRKVMFIAEFDVFTQLPVGDYPAEIEGVKFELRIYPGNALPVIRLISLDDIPVVNRVCVNAYGFLIAAAGIHPKLDDSSLIR